MIEKVLSLDYPFSQAEPAHWLSDVGDDGQVLQAIAHCEAYRDWAVGYRGCRAPALPPPRPEPNAPGPAAPGRERMNGQPRGDQGLAQARAETTHIKMRPVTSLAAANYRRRFDVGCALGLQIRVVGMAVLTGAIDAIGAPDIIRASRFQQVRFFSQSEPGID